MVPINRSLRLPKGQWVEEVCPKDALVIHFTVSQSARNDFAWWCTDPRRIATPYLLDKDGTVYEVYPPEHWASHLGAGVIHEKRTIGIEIVNEGPLQLGRDGLYRWPFPEFKNRYQGAVKDFGVERGGFRYWAAFTPEQQEVIGPLCKQICDQFGIPFDVPPPAKWLQYDPVWAAKRKGIFTHRNIAKKLDVGPAFDPAWLTRVLQP